MTNCKTVPQIEHHGLKQERGRAENSTKHYWAGGGQ